MNPYRREWSKLCGGELVPITTEELVEKVENNWEDNKQDAEEGDSLGRAAMRIRHGAIASSKRLRRENELLRQQVLRLQVGNTIESDFITAGEDMLLAALASARREIQALEWLLINESSEHRRSKGSVLVTVERLRGKVVVFMSDPSRPDLCRVTYAQAADALGWDGKVTGG